NTAITTLCFMLISHFGINWREAELYAAKIRLSS
ncbi:hypothetical protein SASC598J21_001230, partial [Snodgrassella alvi SCGC AB-598-J21]